MLPRRPRLRAGVLLTTVAATSAVLAALLVPVAGVTTAHAARTAHTTRTAHTAAGKDPRRTRGLFVDPTMPAQTRGGAAYRSIYRNAQALWIIPEAYPTGQVRGVVRRYTSRALEAGKTPVLAVYGIPDRDCGMYSSGGLPGATEYRSWIRHVARGVEDQKALLVLEPDAIPFYGDPRCENAGDRLGLLRFASRVLSRAGAWVYLDAGHSDWRPYGNRTTLLKRAGIAYDRGFSTNVSNFRPTGDEQRYARLLLSGLRRLGVKGKHYVVDTSRNGSRKPVDGDVINPTWARVGARPRLVFQHGFDGRLWVKHPGESDGEVNGGGPSGQWCDLLADRLLGRADSGGC